MDSKTILKDLKSKGLKSTKVRGALIESLLTSNSPLSIADLLEKLSRKNLNPNKTTLYREISTLKEASLVEEVEFGDGQKRYEISDSHHHHIICISCKTVVDIPMEADLNSKEKEIIQKHNFKPIGHSLEFFGLCQNCQ